MMDGLPKEPNAQEFCQYENYRIHEAFLKDYSSFVILWIKFDIFDEAPSFSVREARRMNTWLFRYLASYSNGACCFVST